MTRQSIKEYLEAIRGRYLKSSKEEKGKILDEFTQVTHLHRKAAIRLLKPVFESSNKKRRGRRRKYDSVVIDSLKTAWEASDRLCSKRLKPFMPEILSALRSHGELHINTDTQAQLCQETPELGETPSSRQAALPGSSAHAQEVRRRRGQRLSFP